MPTKRYSQQVLNLALEMAVDVLSQGDVRLIRTIDTLLYMGAQVSNQCCLNALAILNDHTARRGRVAFFVQADEEANRTAYCVRRVAINYARQQAAIRQHERPSQQDSTAYAGLRSGFLN